MSFLQPWMLAALPLVALPIIIHLINQRRFQTIPWAAMMFLLAAQRMARGYSRLRQWLILCCRTLAVAGLVLAVSRPMSSGWLGLTVGGRPDTTLVLLDRSPSMQQQTPAGDSKFTTACRQLVPALETLGSGHWALIESAGNRPIDMQSPATLLNLPEASPASSSADLPAMLQSAHQYIRDNHTGRTELWICSDLRENDWQPQSGRWQALRDALAETPQGVRIHLLSYPQSASSNVSVRATDVRRQPTAEGAELLVSLELAREGGAGNITVPVQFEIEGARSVIDVEVGGGRTDLKNHRIPLERTQHRGWGRISIPADANPADNEFYFVFDDPPPRRTIVVAEDDQAGQPLLLAADVSPEPSLKVSATAVSPDALTAVQWNEVALVLWQARLPTAAAADLLKDLVQRGRQVIFLPPHEPDASELFGVRWQQWDEEKQDFPVKTWRSDEDLLVRTQDGAALPLGELAVHRYCSMTGETIPLATLASGDPLLARAATARGGVYFWSTTPAAADSSLASGGVVLYAAVQRALSAGAQGLGKARMLDAGETGEDPAEWRRLAGSEDAMSTEYAFHAGVYAAGDRLLAVNRPASEDNARIVPRERVAELFRGLNFVQVDDRPGSLSSLVQEIWRSFLAVMLVALVLEAALCLPKRARQCRSGKMKAAGALSLVASPWSIAGGIVMTVATAALCFAAWRRSGYRRDFGLLELLRLGIVAACAVLLNQPEWVEQFRPAEKPSIAVLCDASASMQLADVPLGASSSSQRTTRREAIALLQDMSFWKPIQGRLGVFIEPFSPAETAKGTNLYEPLAQAPQKFKNLRAVVLASDGDWNEGLPPVQAAAALRLKDIPVYAVPVGSPTRLPDIELLSLDAPTFAIVGKSVRVPFTIESTLAREHAATVTLTLSDGEKLSQEVRITPMGRTTDSILWKPKDVGEFTLTLDIPRHNEESLPDNNRLSAPITIREEKLRVLVVESAPRWEYRYLRNALSRDPGVELSCLLFHPGLAKLGGGNRDYIKHFPRGLDELARYDVVFLGDVGVEDGQLTADDCRLLRGLVQHQASGLVFLPGWQGRQSSLLETELGEICPVVLDSSQPGGWGSRTPNHFELTETGRRSLLTKLADTQEENIEVWENLPGFQWYAPVLRAKAGSEVLAVHKDISNEFGRLPLLATRIFGAGKVLFMGTDGAWRWRKGVEDKYHYRFWGQVVRWMAYQRNMAKGETMRLYYAPDQPEVRQTIALSANVMERSGEPLVRGDVVARIVPPSGKAETIRFVSSGDEWGAMAARFTPQEAGRHEVTLSCQQTGGSLNTTFFVRSVPLERLGQAARPEVLDEIARVTRGRVISAGQLEQVVQSLAAMPDPPASVRRLQLWCQPWLMGSLVTLLGVFWIGRKMIGVI